MARTDPQTAADRWATNLGQSTEAIKAGVQNVKVAPGILAARNADAWLANIQASKDKWAKNVASVSLEDWQSKMVDVGIGRIATGAAANKPKMAAFMSEFLPFLDRVTANTRSMPNVTLEQRIQRMVSQVRGTAEFKRSGR